MPVPTWVTEAGVLGTWVVGVLALFGDRIRAVLFKPKLHLELKSSVGVYCPQDVVENDIKGEEARALLSPAGDQSDGLPHGSRRASAAVRRRTDG